MSKEPFITIVIPTRNRPELALKAAESACREQLSDVEIIVSDNSDINLKGPLKESVKTLADSRIKYISPDHVMSMAEHWEWAVAQAQGEYVTVLTDRSVFKKSSLGFIRDILKKQKINVLSYLWDSLSGTDSPYIYTQRSYTNKVYKFESRYLINLASHSVITPVYPRMLNSFVSNNLLKNIRDDIGKISESLAPDYAFCFRILDSVDEIHLYDFPSIIVYGDYVSNGFNYSRNTGSETVNDFYKLAKNNIEIFAPVNSLLPIPYNVELLEYNYVMNSQKSGNFMKINIQEFYDRSFSRAIMLSSCGANMCVVFNLLNKFAELKKLSKFTYKNKKIIEFRSAIYNFMKKIAFILLSNVSESQREIISYIFNIKKAVNCTSVDEAILYDDNYPKKTNDKLDRESLRLL